MIVSTATVKNFDGIPIVVPNVIVLDTEEYYVSYNVYDSRKYGSDTTALVVGSRFFILNGNHVKNYTSCESLEKCLAYFNSQSDLINKYSDRTDD